MRLKKTNSKNKSHYSIIEDINKNGKRTTKVYENIGDEDALALRAGAEPVDVWVKKYLKELNDKKREGNKPEIIKKSPNTLINKDKTCLFNVGHFFISSIYKKLQLDEICSKISSTTKIKFNMSDILQLIITARILNPSSKLGAFNSNKNYLFLPDVKLENIYRSLKHFANNKSKIIDQVYKNSKKHYTRNTRILYYDCTNYYFEIEESNGLKQYGKSKENRPNPVVQMGMFLDSEGLPITYSLTPGNTNEQTTLIPLEKTIENNIKDAELVIVCTDAGLASNANRKYNNTVNRSFVTTQSIKKLKTHLKKEALDLTNGWKIHGDPKKYDISKLKTDENLRNQYRDTTFYKERWINENGLEQRLIVTYSVKYQQYKSKIRENQVERAKKIVEKNPSKLSKPKDNDPKRFISTVNLTKSGEVAEEQIYSINKEIIDNEEMYDGLYAVCTNLKDDVSEIIRINSNRWEIEESFRLLKTNFEARPVYVSLDNHIEAHFLTCFLSLLIYRLIEVELASEFSADQIINTIRSMKMLEDNGVYLPAYTRTDITDLLHDKFKFRTDYECTTYTKLNKIFKKL